MESTQPAKKFRPKCRTLQFCLLATALALFAGCTEKKSQPVTPGAAKALFEATVKNYHLPSAEARGEARDRLLREAAAGYAAILRAFPDQPYWSAQALRSLGNIRATEGKIEEALGLYSDVQQRYPGETWEVLQSLKGSADLLWDAGQETRAREFYLRIVNQYDAPSASPVVKAVVRGSRARLTVRLANAAAPQDAR